MSSPTKRTLDALRKDGWVCGVVEKTIPYSFIKQDFLGFIDLIAVKDSILAVQATSIANGMARIRKALASKNLVPWLEAGGKFQVWAWGRKGKKGTFKHWTVNIYDVYTSKVSSTIRVLLNGLPVAGV